MLKVENLKKTFTSPFSRRPPMEAVRGVSFEINPGEVFALLGPNGAGKSTIIKMIAGLIVPSSGNIFINGENTAGKSIVYKHMSAVLEGTRNVYWRLNPIENLHYFANLRGVTSNSIEKKAENLLVELDIDAKKKNQSQHLSRGMLQKLALGVSLITSPDLLLLDEPTLGLDVASSRKIKDKIRELTKKENKAILLTTHQLDLVEELADRVGIIRNGSLVLQGTLSELKSIFQTYIFRLKVKSGWNPSEKLIKDYKIEIKPTKEDSLEMDLDCKDKDGIYKFLKVLEREKVELVHFYRLEEDLEEIFLRVLKG
ncbi:MAG: ABC transporter ATP-binding protein [Leptospiraceae bacterium]|nr:ABC transporter ATP-binding protein [Leptospiraceae bacterium]